MKKFIFLLSLSSVIRTATVQLAVPMYAVPPPLPMLVHAVAVQLPQARTTTSTSTTPVPRSVAVAVPVPVAMQYAMPAYTQPQFCLANPRPQGCPPCPPCLCLPSCTPAFYSYCSPCHQKCRCRNSDYAPIPIPSNQAVALPAPAFPVPAPSPVLVVPFPPVRLPKPRLKHKAKQYLSSDTSSRTSTDDSREYSSDDSVASSDSDYFYKRARKRNKSHRKHKRHPARRNIHGRSRDSEVVKPVLTYLSKNGNVKYKTKISNAQASRLLGEKEIKKGNRAVETVQVVTNTDSDDRPQIVVLSHNEDSRRALGHQKIVMKDGSSKHAVQGGKKELVFRPPKDKRITNLSVSFQVSE